MKTWWRVYWHDFDEEAKLGFKDESIAKHFYAGRKEMGHRCRLVRVTEEVVEEFQLPESSRNP